MGELRAPAAVAVRARGLQRLLRAAAAAAVVIIGSFPAAAVAAEAVAPGAPVVGFSGELSPGKLPRSVAAPAALRLGFTAEVPGSPAIPELTSIRFELSRDVVLRTAGLPSCRITALYSQSPYAEEACAGSLVGHGTVISEVTLPGQAPLTIEGHLSAFYDLAGSQPRVLAEVTSTGPLPLTYVLPFAIEREQQRQTDDFATALWVRHMQFIAGICARGRPDCFSQTYTYKGIYGHISKLELTLDRRFVHAGRSTSFVSADCPARRGAASATRPLANVALAYSEGSLVHSGATRRCQVRPARRGHQRPRR